MICSICKNNSAKEESNSFEFFKLYTKFRFLTCDNCGHVLILPPQSDSKSGQEYIRKYTNLSPELNKSVLSRVKHMVNKYALDKSSSVYDIGSGNCQYGMAFSNLGFRCVAVDVERFNVIYSPFVYSKDLDAVLIEEESCIFFSNHSFEHIDPTSLKNILGIIAKKLDNKSSCLFVIPSPKKFLINFGIYLEEFVYGHNNLFSEKSARLFFKECLNLNNFQSIEVVSPRVRVAFLKTRIALAKDYLKNYYFHKAFILMCYIICSLIFGSKEEIWIRVNKVRR